MRRCLTPVVAERVDLIQHVSYNVRWSINDGERGHALILG